MAVPYSGRKVFLNLLASLAGSGAGLVSLAVCMHLLGSEGVRIRGVIAFSAALVGFASVLTETGFTNAHVKRVSEGKDLARCVGTYGAIRILQSLLLAFIFLPVVLSPTVFLWIAGASSSGGSGVERTVLGVTVLSVVLNQIGDIWRQTYAARREVVHQRFPIVLGNWLQIPAAVFACGVLPVNEKTPLWWALANLVTPVTALLYYAIWAERLPWSRPTRENFTNYSKFAAPMTLSGAFLSIQLYLDKWFLKRWVGYEAVGLYELAQKVVQTFDRQILAQIGNLVLSKISQLHAAGKISEIRDLVRASERYLAFLAVPACAVMIAMPAEILALLYGRSASGAAEVFSILAVVGCSASLNRPYAQAVAGMDRPVYMLWLGGVMAALDFMFNLVFIPDRLVGFPMLGMGAFGAALSTLLAALLGTVLNRWMAVRVSGRGLLSLALLRHLLSGAMGAAIGTLVVGADVWWRWATGASRKIFSMVPGLPASWEDLLAVPELWQVFFGGFAAGGGYLATLGLLREITREDIAFFREAASLRKAFSSVSTDLKR